jgi:hypothetical protein
MYRYISSLYWVEQTVVTVGYGNVILVNSFERWFAVLIMFAGVIFFSLTVGAMSSILLELDTNEKALEEKMLVLGHIKNNYMIPERLTTKIKNYLRNWVVSEESDTNKMLNKLPPLIRQDLCRTIYKDLINSLDVLKGKHNRFVSRLCPQLKQFHASEGQAIYNENNSVEEVYFILKGSVELIEPNDLFRVEIKEGDIFGEMEANSNEPRISRAVSLDKSSILILTKADYYSIFFEEYQDVGKDIARCAAEKRKAWNNH